jgi:hypothetical protein
METTTIALACLGLSVAQSLPRYDKGSGIRHQASDTPASHPDPQNLSPLDPFRAFLTAYSRAVEVARPVCMAEGRLMPDAYCLMPFPAHSGAANTGCRTGSKRSVVR